MAEAVVGGALLLVGEDRIGLVDFLEPRRGFFAAVVAVGVMLHRELAKGRLQPGVVSFAGYAQNFVVVAHESVRCPGVSC